MDTQREQVCQPHFNTPLSSLANTWQFSSQFPLLTYRQKRAAVFAPRGKAHPQCNALDYTVTPFVTAQRGFVVTERIFVMEKKLFSWKTV